MMDGSSAAPLNPNTTFGGNIFCPGTKKILGGGGLLLTGGLATTDPFMMNSFPSGSVGWQVIWEVPGNTQVPGGVNFRLFAICANVQ